MSVTSRRLADPPVWLGAIFDRIVCGVDETESSRSAVAQAGRLLAARRMLELVAIVEEGAVASNRERRYVRAQEILREERSRCPRARSLLLFGDPGPQLVSAAREVHATLVVVGAPPAGGPAAFVLGRAATHVLQDAPCSVLIARQPADEDAFPRSIVVGHDGSAGAAAATLVAKELAHRFGATLRVVVATGGEPVDVDGLPSDEEIVWSSAPPVDALETASAEADLLVVGSRGLRGFGGLSSVSARIGQSAHCSVLVVRQPPDSSRMETGAEDEVPDSEC